MWLSKIYMLGRVEARGGHLLRDRVPDRVCDSLAQRAGGGLDARGLEGLRVARVPLWSWRKRFICSSGMLNPARCSHE